MRAPITAATTTHKSIDQPSSGLSPSHRATRDPRIAAMSTADAMMIPYQWSWRGPNCTAMGPITRRF
jgi:hypothetical protein